MPERCSANRLTQNTKILTPFLAEICWRFVISGRYMKLGSHEMKGVCFSENMKADCDAAFAANEEHNMVLARHVEWVRL